MQRPASVIQTPRSLKVRSNPREKSLGSWETPTTANRFCARKSRKVDIELMGVPPASIVRDTPLSSRRQESVFARNSRFETPHETKDISSSDPTQLRRSAVNPP